MNELLKQKINWLEKLARKKYDRAMNYGEKKLGLLK